MKIGIIGHGFVGQAVANAHEADILLINDPKLGSESVKIEEIKRQAEWIYVCVPTPMSTDGTIDTSILSSVFASLDGYTKLVISSAQHCPRFI